MRIQRSLVFFQLESSVKCGSVLLIYDLTVKLTTMWILINLQRILENTGVPRHVIHHSKHVCVRVWMMLGARVIFRRNYDEQRQTSSIFAGRRTVADWCIYNSDLWMLAALCLQPRIDGVFDKNKNRALTASRYVG